MAKRALLIGVNEYKVGLAGLSSPIKNVEALRKILKDDNGYEVDCLSDPLAQDMRKTIERFFQNVVKKDDLAILFFSGHGITDERGALYFAARDTEKVEGKLTQSTSVSARDIQSWLQDSRCRHKVIILDCCFSGAFPTGMQYLGHKSIDFVNQLLGSLNEEVETRSSYQSLGSSGKEIATKPPDQFPSNDHSDYGGKGIVILTSSSKTEHSFEKEGQELSIYAHYLVEGLGTESADRNQDRYISAKELHDYVYEKVKQEKPEMTPNIFGNGGEIVIARVKRGKEYQEIVQKFVQESGGKIPDQNLKLVRANAHDLGLSDDEAVKIEEKVLKPFQEHEKNLNDYREHFRDALKNDKRYPFTPKIQEALKPWQKRRELKDEEIEGINRSEILGFYKEELKQIDSDAKTRKARKEVQRKADELMLSLSLAKQDVQKINNEILDNEFKLFKYPLFYVFVVIFLAAITYGIAVGKSPDKDSRITDVTTDAEGTFRYTTSSTWAPVVCDGNGIDTYITNFTNKGKFKLLKANTNIYTSNQAFDNLIERKDGYAFAIISSNITPEMEEKAGKNGIEIGKMTIATDAIAIGVNNELQIKSGLIFEDLKRIYMGESKTWSQLLKDRFEGKDTSLNIVPLSRPFSGSLVGTSKYFFQEVLKILPNEIQDIKSKQIITEVENTSDGINKLKEKFVGGIYFATATEMYGEGIKIVPVGEKLEKLESPYKDKNFFPRNHCKIEGNNMPVSSSILNEKYPKELIRPISVVWIKYNNISGSDKDKNNEAAAIAYAKMLKTKEGQAILRGIGFFPHDYLN